MNRNQVLEEAKAAINRAPKSYGNPLDHFKRVAKHWNAHLSSIGSLDCTGAWHVPDLKPHDVAIMLGLVKIARLEHDPQHADSWCDLAGYAACGAEVSEPVVPYTVTIDPTPLPYWVPTVGTFGWMEAEKEPAWKRAKVGDRIRIREGAKSLAGNSLPAIGVVERIDFGLHDFPDWRVDIHPSGGHGLTVRNADVLEILPPLPESKFGFTVGETVNLKSEPYGRNPGTAEGFSDDRVLVRWSHRHPSNIAPGCVRPDALRHGA